MRSRQEKPPRDVEEIREIFHEIYGDDYPFRDFYDPAWLKRAAYSDRVLLVVAQEGANGPILGTGSVDLDTGSHSDLLGEFGRLVVKPQARG